MLSGERGTVTDSPTERRQGDPVEINSLDLRERICRGVRERSVSTNAKGTRLPRLNSASVDLGRRIIGKDLRGSGTRWNPVQSVFSAIRLGV